MTAAHVLPGNRHTVDPDRPLKVTGAETYRLYRAGIIEPTYPSREAMISVLEEPYRPGPGQRQGWALYESQEHSVMWWGPAENIERFAADPAAGPLDATGGIWADRWPNSPAWVRPGLIEAHPWNPDGAGIVTEIPHTSGTGTIVIYEHVGSWDGEDRPVISMHCTRCHGFGDQLDNHLSDGPATWRWVGQMARGHARDMNGRCRADLSHMDKAWAVVGEVVGGRPKVADPAGMYAASCATDGAGSRGESGALHTSSCAAVRAARVATSRLG